MSFIKENFTDPQGVTHDSAYFEVSIANKAVSVNQDYNNRISIDKEEVNEFTNKTLSYQMYYWTSEAAKDEGKPPYYLVNLEPLGEFFYVNELDSEHDNLTAKESAELHCSTVVLV